MPFYGESRTENTDERSMLYASYVPGTEDIAQVIRLYASTDNKQLIVFYRCSALRSFLANLMRTCTSRWYEPNLHGTRDSLISSEFSMRTTVPNKAGL